MSAELTTKANLAEYVGGTDRLNAFFQGSDAAITTAIRKASDMFNAAAKQQYTEESVDALTASTVPYEPRQHIEACSIYFGTAGDDVQPESHRLAYEDAKGYFGRLRRGEVTVDGLVTIGSSSGNAGGGGIRGASPDEKLLDFNDSLGRYQSHFPRLP